MNPAPRSEGTPAFVLALALAHFSLLLLLLSLFSIMGEPELEVAAQQDSFAVHEAQELPEQT